MKNMINLELKKIILLLLFICFYIQTFSMEKIRVQFKWKHQFQFAGYYAAKENGYYKKSGMDVELIEYFDETPVEAVLNGKADFGIASSEIIMEKAKGKKIVLLASVFQHSPYVFIAKKESGINSIHDIADKKIAIDKGASELILYLKSEGMDVKKLNLVDNPFDMGPLIDGKIDISAAYTTDEIFQLQEKGVEYNLFNPRTGGVDFYGDSLFTSEEFLKKHPEIVEKFIRESMRGWKYALENKTELIEIILAKYSKRHSREHLMFEAKETEKLIMPNIVTIGYFNKERWERTAKLYEEMGIIPKEYSLNGFFYKNKVEVDNNFIKNILIYGVIVIMVVALVMTVILRFNMKLKKEIVENEKIQLKLKENEAKYKLLAENTVECIWLLNIPKMKFEYISPSIINLRGLTVEEAMAESLEDSLTPESLEKVNAITMKRVKSFMDGNRDKETIEGLTEVKQYKKDGSVIDVEISTKYICDEESKELKVLGVSRDITDRKKIEKQLEKEIKEKNLYVEKIVKSEKKMKELIVIMEQMPVSIVITDLGGNIEYVNQYALNISGYKKEETMGRTPRIFKSGVHPISFYREIWQEITQGKIWKGEMINEKRNGDRYKEFVTISPVKDENGVTYSYIAIKEIIK